MRQKRDVIEYQLKKIMLGKCLSNLSKHFDNEFNNSNGNMKNLYKNLIEEIKLFKENDSINYKLAFLFCITQGKNYNKITQNENLFNSTIKEMVNEKNWDSGNISFEVSIYFSYVFFNELYKDISIDIYRIDNSSHPLIELSNILKEI